MSRQPPAKRAQRLQEIAKEVGAVLENFDSSPLLPPSQSPTFMVPDDERRADAILGQLRIEDSSRQQGRRISSAFGKTPKQSVYSYTELYQAMGRVLEENGPPGVLEVLLRRFRLVDGNINFSKRGSTSALKRVRGKESEDERGGLLSWATGNSRADFVQLLAPLADEQSLNEALDVALSKRDMSIVELLVRYGANTAMFQSTVINVVKNGDYPLLEILLRSKKRVSQQCLDQSLLVAASAPRGSLICLLLLTWAGANADHDGASALMRAIEAENVELTAAIVSAQKPPSGPSLDKALGSLFSQPSTPAPSSDGQYLLLEVLLCGGPVGDAANHALMQATFLANLDMMQLLLSHQVDINFDNACAVGHAIQRNRSDLMGTLLQSQTLKPEVASELVRHIPAKIPPMNKVAILSKLLVNGASGAYCSEQLILAAESNDLDTAQLLVTYGLHNNAPPVCSVNYNGARCLKTAVSRNNIQMVKLLALEGDPSKYSLAQAFSAIPPNISGDDHFLVVQTLLRGGAAGPEVDEALHSAVISHKQSHRLIEVLVQFKANVTETTLLGAISQGSTTILNILLTGNVSAAICGTAITTAMKLPMTVARFKIIEKLLGPATTSNAEVPEVSKAVIEIIQNCPEDLDLLDLLCRQGKANLNSEDGLAVVLATKHPNFTLLKIVLNTGLPSSSTIEKALDCAINLPLTDPNRHLKVKALLWKVRPQEAINKAFIQEISSALKSGQYSPVIPVLLHVGADVNAEDGKPLQLAVTDPALTDLLLSKRPTVHSLSQTFPAALELKDPARLVLCEKLLRAGAVGDEISKALCVVVEEGPPAISLLRLIIPHADINHKDGHALNVAVKNGFVEGHELLLNSRASATSAATRTSAFQEALKLKDEVQRRDMVKRLLKSGIDREIVSDALINAVNLEDFQLSQILMQNGASVEHKGGQAVCSAASAGNSKILKLLVSEKPSMSTLFTGFGGALSLSGESYFEILQILLEAGMRGEAVDDALVETVKQGDASLKMTELLCKNGASVEWRDGEVIVIAAGSGTLQTLDLLLERQPSQGVLGRAYIAASTLSNEQYLQVIERLLKAGKEIDTDVRRSLTVATMKEPSDRQMIKMLLARGIFDEGQAMVHAARTLDLRTLSMLVSSPKSAEYTSHAFEAVVINDELWKSATGLAVVKLLLEKGASGPAVAEALYQAVVSLENILEDTETLANEFIDACLKAGADVDYQRGLPLQRATLQANIPLLTKLLPGACPESKAMAMPYVFTVCDNKAAVLTALEAFTDSYDNGDEGLDIMFRHPDQDLEPILFLALQRFPRDTQILRYLLDMGFSANQWQFCANESDLEPEKWPILCWALEQPEKKISTSVIEMLIEAGADVNFTSKTGTTPLWLAIQNQRVDIVSKLISRGVNVTVEDAEGITPLALASSMNNIALMECILEADAEVDDGSLHDVARDMKMDKMRILIKYGHRVNYPSDRHGGRSALAELCLKAVDHDPTVRELEKVIRFLINNDAKIGLRNVSGKTIFHYAMDSSNPVLILTAMLKVLWEHINDDAFLYIDKNYTYSLTKYVEKNKFSGPSTQKEEILSLLRKKQAIDRFWAQDIMAIQPDDYCNGPPHIEDEVIRQKARLKRQAEMREEAQYALELKRIAAVGEVEILQIAAKGEYQRMQEKACVEKELLEAQAITQLQISEDAWSQTSRMQEEARLQDVRHQRQLGDVQIHVARRIKEEAAEQDRSRNMMQIEYLDKKIEMENGGYRQRLMIEEQGAEGMNRVQMKEHEREMARIKMQKQLLGQQQSLANSFGGGAAVGGGYPGQRQIGFISEVPN